MKYLAQIFSGNTFIDEIETDSNSEEALLRDYSENNPTQVVFFELTGLNQYMEAKINTTNPCYISTPEKNGCFFVQYDDHSIKQGLMLKLIAIANAFKYTINIRKISNKMVVDFVKTRGNHV